MDCPNLRSPCNHHVRLAVGTGDGDGCAAGLHMIDISRPTAPSFAGCFADDGYHLRDDGKQYYAALIDGVLAS